ncbi:MAG TPA: hypothetical protein VEO95_04660 [Chthoniobacteraceae bacterium]|nr:hypothetical protein [Chthoniobacteraceae bacterium]
MTSPPWRRSENSPIERFVGHSRALVPCDSSVKRKISMNHLLVRHKVADFTKWKAAYDAHVSARENAGLKELHLLRNADRMDEVVILFEVRDVGKAREFANSTELREAMQNAGVTDKPDIWFLA